MQLLPISQFPTAPGFRPSHQRPPLTPDLAAAARPLTEGGETIAALQRSIDADRDVRDPALAAKVRQGALAVRDSLGAIALLKPHAQDVLGSLDKVVRMIDSNTSVTATRVTLYRAATGIELLTSMVGTMHAERFSRHVDDIVAEQLVRFDRDRDGSITKGSEVGAMERERIFDVRPWLVHRFDATGLIDAADGAGNRDGRAQRAELAAIAARFDSDQDGWLSVDQREQLHRAAPVLLSSTKEPELESR